MAEPIVKSFEAPEESHSPSGNGRVDVVKVGEVTIGRATFPPGWHWSRDVKPHAGTELCQVTHTGYVVSGRSMVRMADGTEVELGPGDAFVIPAGHDTWVVGDEAYVSVDFTGGAAAQTGQPERAR
jgi:quercetin dioxygenase-like cupin family protein